MNTKNETECDYIAPADKLCRKCGNRHSLKPPKEQQWKASYFTKCASGSAAQAGESLPTEQPQRLLGSDGLNAGTGTKS